MHDDDTDPTPNDDAPHADWIAGQMNDLLTEAIEAKGLSTMQALAAIDAWSDVERFDYIRDSTPDEAAKQVMTSMELAKLRGKEIFARAPPEALETVIEDTPVGTTVSDVSDALTAGMRVSGDVPDHIDLPGEPLDPEDLPDDFMGPMDIDVDDLPADVRVIRLDALEHPDLADRLMRDLRDAADVADDMAAEDDDE